MPLPDCVKRLREVKGGDVHEVTVGQHCAAAVCSSGTIAAVVEPDRLNDEVKCPARLE